MSNTSLCATVLLLPPEGHINILHAPHQPHSPPQVTLRAHTHIQTHGYRYKQTLFQELTDCLCCLPPWSIRSQDQACPHMEAFGPTPSLISLLPPWLNQAGHFWWGRSKESNNGREDPLPNSRQAVTNCSSHTHLFSLHFSVYFPSLAFTPFVFLKASRFEKWINAYTICVKTKMWSAENGNESV